MWANLSISLIALMTGASPTYRNCKPRCPAASKQFVLIRSHPERRTKKPTLRNNRLVHQPPCNLFSAHAQDRILRLFLKLDATPSTRRMSSPTEHTTATLQNGSNRVSVPLKCDMTLLTLRTVVPKPEAGLPSESQNALPQR